MAGSEQESARGSFRGETPGIFIVLSGFATSGLSVDFDARQGAEPMEKRLRCWLLPVLCFLLTCSFRLYPLILWITVLPPLSELTPLAAVERPSVASQ
ncbi:hypothetical protein [Escherichia coli]|uniref:hypothetical protein n=1 Tax=Escherichia coli TaxID=562 RepID=UPI001551DEA4|nr:hypothetical protein [Escherichia coli]